MNIVFMGTPQFAVPFLEQLLDSPYRISAVVTRPDRPAGRGHKMHAPPIKEVAERANCPVLQPESLNDESFRQTMNRIRPDLVCVVAYGGFLPKWLLELPKYECINVHPSLLPTYRGAAPIQRAIMNGDAHTGVTTMYMSEAMDAGDVILQQEVPIHPTDDSGSLHDRLAQIGAPLLLQTVQLIERGEAPRLVQDEHLVTFAPKIEREDECIQWDASAHRIDCLVRALKPRPGAYTMYRGRRLKIWATSVESKHTSEVHPGTITHITHDFIAVATGEGTLHIHEVQPENSRRVPTEAFIHGHQPKIGDRFEIMT